MSRGARSVVDQIEFLAPRDSLFGGDGPAEFAGVDIDDLPPLGDTPERPSWLTGAAALAVLALVAVGVVAAAPWDQADPAVAPPPTTVVPPETAAVQHPIPGWGEVWATPDATATGGSWFSVTLLNGAHIGTQGMTKVDLGGRVGLLERAPDSTLRLSAPVGGSAGSQVLIVKSLGRSADDLIALFSSIAIEDDRPQFIDDRPIYLDPAQLEGFVKLAGQSTSQDLIDAYLGGAPRSTTSYTNGTGGTYITVDTFPLDPDLEVLGRLAVGPSRIFASNGSIPDTFTGEDLVLGASPTGPEGELVARWVDDGTVVVLRTNLPLGQLLDLLPTVVPT